MKEISDNSFVEEVEDYKGLVVADFWAAWCGPCKMLSPVIDELSKEFGDSVKFVKVNVDDNPEISSKYRIVSIPTIMIFNNGKVSETIVGFRPKAELAKVIQKHI